MKKKWPIILIVTLAVLTAVISANIYFQPIDGQNKKILGEATSTDLNQNLPLTTPKKVKGIYMTGYTFSQPARREKLFKLIDDTELNTVVIDFKDPSGKLMFEPKLPQLANWPISSVALDYDAYKNVLNNLQERDIYAIARITTFQDTTAAKAFPNLALKNKNGGVWQDYRGVKWLDMTNPLAWALVAAQAQEAKNIGFDEVQFDYIRFPSDGNLGTIAYYNLGNRKKAEVLKDFYAYLRQELSDLNIPLSIDLFGLTYQRHPENPGYDMGIGQRLADAFIYFDYISPMVYPSHYRSAYAGCAAPVLCPYAVVNKAMKEGNLIMAATASDTVYTFSTSAPFDFKKNSKSLNRPWLQDFNLGAVYTADMVKAQIKAADDNNVSGWLLWNAGNNYTAGALSTQ